MQCAVLAAIVRLASAALAYRQHQPAGSLCTGDMTLIFAGAGELHEALKKCFALKAELQLRPLHTALDDFTVRMVVGWGGARGQLRRRSR